MKITRVSLHHLSIPCNSVFSHSRADRKTSEVILVELTTDTAKVGWGEILPRSYVTGETIQSVMATDHTEIVNRLLKTNFNSYESYKIWITKELGNGRSNLSLIGGIEIAVISLLAQTNNLNLDDLVGPARVEAPGRCITIGLDCNPDNIRARFISAKLQSATAIKLKVGQSLNRDSECILHLSKLCGKEIALRLDGNATQSIKSTCELLDSVENLNSIQSYEEPVSFDEPERDEALRELHLRYGVDLMADESLCSIAETEKIISSKTFQRFNVRVGKQGGLFGSARIRDMAQNAGINVVGGSMVGETHVLSQASNVFLQRSAIEYVEGIEENRKWLKEKPLLQEKGPADCFNKIRKEPDAFNRCLMQSVDINF